MVEQKIADTQPTLLRAAEYVRMSTDQQQFSIGYQQAAIRLYAAQRGMSVVKTYSDEGRSGLTLHERPAMIQLLAEVEAKSDEFDVILVYDVSRWGRYQDTDEGAFYEFKCRQAGKRVEYCAEQFPSENGPIVAVLKAIKRAMAAEYSRELAVRVHSAHVRGVARGFLQGGISGYGLRRMLLDHNGTPKGILPSGAVKYLRTDRVVLVPGPKEETDVVRRIFDMYVNQGIFKKRIHRILNAERVPFTDGRPWTSSTVNTLLCNERYIGTLTFGKTASLLRQGKGYGRVKSVPGAEIKGDAGYDPIVSPDLFAKANTPQSLSGAWYRDEALLDALRKLWRKHGYLSHALIESTQTIASPQTFRKRFGTFTKAYERIGYVPQKDKIRVARLPVTHTLVSQIAEQFQAAAAKVGLWPTFEWRKRLLTFEDGTSIRIAVSRYLPTRYDQRPRWELHTNPRVDPEFLIVARMDRDHLKPLDYYFMEASALKKRRSFFDRHLRYERYHCDTAAQAIKCAILAIKAIRPDLLRYHKRVYRAAVHPGTVMVKALETTIGVSQREAAKLMGFSHTHLQLILKCERPLSREMALRYEKLGGPDARSLLRMQAIHYFRKRETEQKR